MSLISFEGVWLIPSLNETYNGKLFLNEEKGIIVLNIFCYDNPEMFFKTNENYELIIGELTQGNYITLLNCKRYKNKDFIASFNVDYALWGIRFNDINSVMFFKMDFELSHLSEWANMYCIDSDSYDVKYLSPPVVEYCHNDYKISILAEIPRRPIGKLSEISLNQSTKIRFESEIQKKLYDFIIELHPVLTLMCLCVNTKIDILNITAYNNEHYDDIGEHKRYHSIKIFTNKGYDEHYEKYSRYDILCMLDLFEPNLDMYFSNWYEKYKILKPVLEIYNETLSNFEMSSERRFLCTTQFLEAYHRRLKYNSVMKKSEFKEMIKSILDNISEEHKNFVKGELEFSNEPSFENRITDLITDSNNVWFYFDDKETMIKFIKKVKNTRNFYTHYDKRLEKKIFQNTELEIAALILKTIFEYHILKEIGLDKDLVENQIKTKYNSVIKKNISILNLN